MEGPRRTGRGVQGIPLRVERVKFHAQGALDPARHAGCQRAGEAEERARQHLQGLRWVGS